MVAVVALLSSCDKSEEPSIIPSREGRAPDEQSASVSDAEFANLRAGSTYSSTPSVGGSVEGDLSSLFIYQGGHMYYTRLLRTTVLRQDGNTFTLRIAKKSGRRFEFYGTAYLKLGSVYGEILGQASVLPNSYFVDIEFTPQFEIGYINVYATMKYEDQGYTYYQYVPPVLIYTYPFHKEDYTYGNVLGTANGVEVKANASSDEESTAENIGDKFYQCTEFCNRYYLQIYGKNIVNTGTQGGNADTWFRNADDKRLKRIVNGSGILPQAGDILCMKGGNGGHVAIIMEVTKTYIKIAHQNSGDRWDAIGASLDMKDTKVANPSGYTVQGWLRIPTYLNDLPNPPIPEYLK